MRAMPEASVRPFHAGLPWQSFTATRAPAGAAGTRSYRVRSGDTLSSISRRHDCRGATQLARANGLRPPYVIRAGQSLKLIGCG